MDNYVISIIKKIALNLGDYDLLFNTIINETNKDCKINSIGLNFSQWDSLTLSDGLPGLCLLYGKIQECFPNDTRWNKISHKYLSYIVENINNKGITNLSMFSGISGIGLCTASISNGFKNYTKLLNTINNYICMHLSNSMEKFKKTIGMHSSYYDIMYGLCGILNYLSIFKDQKEINALIYRELENLVNITNEIKIYDTNVPGWYIPMKNQFSDIEKNLYPEGNFNKSLSHGTAGLLTFFSLMLEKNIQIKGQVEAMEKIVDFYFTYKLNDGKRDFWQGQIGLSEFLNKKIDEKNIYRRDAWCYGSPGICYSIIRAGKILNKTEWVDYGISNLKCTINDIQGIFSPTFCHGYSGIYQILNSIEQLIGTQIFLKEKNMIKKKILDFYDSEYCFGFKNIEIENNKIKQFESVGLLNGVVGICLALIEEEYPSNNLWKTAFLL